MSKVKVSLPDGTIKNGVLGALLSLVCYIALQFLVALLINNEVVGEGIIYPAVCVCAGTASCLGCCYSVLRTGGGTKLSAAAVVTIFLTLTVAISLCLGENEAVSGGLTGVGVSMAAGGIAAALICGAIANKKGLRREKNRNKRRRK